MTSIIRRAAASGSWSNGPTHITPAFFTSASSGRPNARSAVARNASYDPPSVTSRRGDRVVPEPARERLDAGHVEVAEQDERAPSYELLGDGGADAAGGSGDRDGAAGQRCAGAHASYSAAQR